jgi:MFS family permease
MTYVGEPNVAGPPPARLPWRDRALVPVLVLIGLVMALVSSLGAPLIPTIAHADHVSVTTGQWMLTATLLTGAVASPIMGQLADGRARRQVLLSALLAVLAGSLIAAVLNGFPALLAGRAMQGLGLGLIPTAMVVARRHLPPAAAARLIAVLSVTAGIGIGLGYPLTGLIAERADYHLAFWLAVVIVAVTLLAALFVLPRDPGEHPSRLDLPGAALFTVGLLALLTALSEGGAWGWSSAPVIALLLVAAVTGSAWAWYELRAPAPLVVLNRLRSRAVWLTNVSAAVSSVAMYLFLPVVVEFAQATPSQGYGFGSTAAVAGLCLLPMSLATAATSTVVPWALRQIGARTLLPFGQVVLGGALLYFAVEHAALWDAFVSMGIAGVGTGFSFGAMPSLIMAAVPAGESGSGLGLYQVLRYTGFATGSALCGAILAASTTAHHATPPVGGYEAVLFAGALLCTGSALLTLLLPGRPVRAAPAREPSAPAEAVRK